MAIHQIWKTIFIPLVALLGLLLLNSSCDIYTVSEQSTSEVISTAYSTWYKASPPVASDSMYYYLPAWDCYWFSPRDADKEHAVRREEIVFNDTGKGAVPADANYEYVLRFHVTPSPADSLNNRFSKAGPA